MSTTVRISPTAALDLPALRGAVALLDAAPSVDRVILGDDHVSGRSAVVLASWLAPQTRRISLVPEVPVTHTEPFHAATTTATLDHLTAWTTPDGTGRAGWSPTVQTGVTGEAAAALVGLRPAAGEEDAWRHAVDVDEAVSALWTSWDADAEIRDTATARFIDRTKLHYTRTAGTDTAGETFTVTGPSIVPRSPQGDLPTVVTAHSAAALAAASRIADVVIVPADLVADALGAGVPTVLLEVPVSRLVAGGAGAEVPDAVDGFAVTVGTPEDLASLPALVEQSGEPVAP